MIYIFHFCAEFLYKWKIEMKDIIVILLNINILYGVRLYKIYIMYFG